MNKGTFIKCADKEELKNTLAELGDAGYGAVVCDYYRNVIVITSVPEEEGA